MFFMHIYTIISGCCVCYQYTIHARQMLIISILLKSPKSIVDLSVTLDVDIFFIHIHGCNDIGDQCVMKVVFFYTIVSSKNYCWFIYQFGGKYINHAVNGCNDFCNHCSIKIKIFHTDLFYKKYCWFYIDLAKSNNQTIFCKPWDEVWSLQTKCECW